MPRDRSPRLLPSFLSKPFGFAKSPSLRPPSSKNDADGADRLQVDDISHPTAGNPTTQSPATTIVSTSVPGHEFSVIPPPSQMMSLADPHSEHRPTHQSLQPERNDLAFRQATQPNFGTPITHPQAPPHPAQLAYQQYSVGTQYHAPYHGHYPDSEAENLGALFEQRCSMSQPFHQHSNQRLSPLPRNSEGFFNHAHNFVINDSVFVESSSDTFMASLLEATIKGAEFDSSDHNMPLRCHPGTRLEIIKRCQDFILNRDDRPRLRWVTGSAGVGKSAVMQSVAHDEYHALSDNIVGATVFFSINGRQDGSKAITTIAYQLAIKIDPYRRFIQCELTRDPSLLRKSLSTQFNKFIVEPFIQQRILDSHCRLVIIIDGLDECANIPIQKELLGLISNFCIAYPVSPIVWMIASRPEPHITSFFAQPKIALAHEKEEILVDSDEACEDVKRYLRDKFREVQMASITLEELSQWPSENDLLKIARASGGLFAYASTVVRYISDPDYGDPVPLLDDVLEIIEIGTKENIWGRNHPMAQLDALYYHIMAKIPDNVMADTRKLLLSSASEIEYLVNFTKPSFLLLCNMLGMTQNPAYGATHHIRSIAKVPGPAEAGKGRLKFFHKSFPDYLRAFERSGFSPNFDSEANQLEYRCARRILDQAPDGVYVSDPGIITEITPFGSGALKNGPGTGENIPLSWPDRILDNLELRLDMFCQAVYLLVNGFGKGEEAFQSLYCLRVLTTCFTRLPANFPLGVVQDFTFDECRRRELLEYGILKQVPLDTLNYNAIMPYHPIRLRFRGPTVEQSKPWNVECEHEREGSWEGQIQEWSTEFAHWQSDSKHVCYYCSQGFINHFKARQPGHLATVISLTSTISVVELRFVDPDNGVSEWIYLFGIKERKADPEDDECYEEEEDNVSGGAEKEEN